MHSKRLIALLLLSMAFSVTVAGPALALPTADSLLASYPELGFALTAAPQDDPMLVLVNRDHPLSPTFKPERRTPDVARKRGADVDMQPEAAVALEAMFLAAQSEGLSLVAVSGYRSYGKQKTLYARSVERNGQEKADQMSARPGASEHQLGLCMDVSCASLDNVLTSKFARKAEGKWIAAHCAEYGFIIRYQDGWSSVTGYQSEPWHIRYIGRQHAERLTALDVPLETYLRYLELLWKRQAGAP